jgi:hypothetical protein
MEMRTKITLSLGVLTKWGIDDDLGELILWGYAGTNCSGPWTKSGATKSESH